MRGARALVGARVTTWLRGGAGSRVVAPGARPAELLVLYEFEACPFCRRVREALSRLDLEAVIRPCPKGGQRFRKDVEALGGMQQFPFLIDPNTGVRMYESRDIVAYLEREYGCGDAPVSGPADAIGTVLLVASGLGRGVAGSRARAARRPERPLVLYGYEAQPESRLVREALCELEISYAMRPAAPGSARRTGADPEFGGGELPHLVDPNRGVEKSGRRVILRYLEETYALAPKHG